MTDFIFLSIDKTAAVRRVRAGVWPTPAGSFARETKKIGTATLHARLTLTELHALGVAKVAAGSYDPEAEVVTGRDFERNQDNTIKVTAGAATEVLTVDAIPAPAIAARAAAELAAEQERAVASVDAQAEAARLGFITGGAGQALSYREKADEAAECLASYGGQGQPAAPDAGTYPLLESEIGITAETVMAVAQIVAAQRTAWRAIEATINGTRLQAKKDIRAAADVAAVRAVMAALTWPEPE